MTAELLELAVRTLGPAGVIVAYLHVRLRNLAQRVDVVPPVLLALSEEHEAIDEDAVEEALDGIQPSDFREAEP
jgi:hypothetical protein